MKQKFLLCNDELYNGSKFFEVGKLADMMNFDSIHEAKHSINDNTEGY